MFCNVASKSGNDFMLIITTLQNHTAATCHPISKTHSRVAKRKVMNGSNYMAIRGLSLLNTAGEINMSILWQSF